MSCGCKVPPGVALEYVDLVKEEPCRISYTIVPVGAQSEAFDVNPYVACLYAASVVRYFGRHELYLSVAVLGKVVAPEGVPGQAFEVPVVLHIGGDAVFHALRQQNPCSDLVEEVGGNGSDVAVASEVDDDVGIPSAPYSE